MLKFTQWIKVLVFLSLGLVPLNRSVAQGYAISEEDGAKLPFVGKIDGLWSDKKFEEIGNFLDVALKKAEGNPALDIVVIYAGGLLPKYRGDLKASYDRLAARAKSAGFESQFVELMPAERFAKIRVSEADFAIVVELSPDHFPAMYEMTASLALFAHHKIVPLTVLADLETSILKPPSAPIKTP